MATGSYTLPKASAAISVASPIWFGSSSDTKSKFGGSDALNNQGARVFLERGPWHMEGRKTVPSPPLTGTNPANSRPMVALISRVGPLDLETGVLDRGHFVPSEGARELRLRRRLRQPPSNPRGQERLKPRGYAAVMLEPAAEMLGAA